jgi:uncharacterized protein YbjT (DUF2867 family)
MILVTGGTGKVGRNVVAGLVAAGAAVRVLARDPARAGLPGAEVVRGDLGDPASVARAADGCAAAFLLWPGFDPGGAAAVVDVLPQRVVHLSSGDAAAPTPGVWAEVESLLATRAATYLRAGGFMGNTLEWAPAIRAGASAVPVPYPAAGRALIHEKDIAEVAVLALLDPAHAGRAYGLSGPRTLTMTEQVQILGEVLGRPLTAVAQPLDEARAELVAAGMGAVADSSLAYWAGLAEHPEPPDPADVERLTGHPARTYRRWAIDHRADFTA